MSKTWASQSWVTIYRLQASRMALFIVWTHDQIGVLLNPIVLTKASANTWLLAPYHKFCISQPTAATQGTAYCCNALPTSGAEKVLIPLRCSVPAFVFHKGIIAAEIHGHRLATVRADRQKFRWYFHILLPLDHFTDHGFVIEGLLTARLTALEQAVISLRIEQPLFIKASLLKTVVYIGSAYSKSSPFRNTLTLCSSPSPIT